MDGFTYHRRSGRMIATFSGVEADLLRSLASQIVELLHEDRPQADADEDPFMALMNFNEPKAEPEDPVLKRLLPNAYPDDQESAAEFRRFTESSLRDHKVSGARRIVDTLNEAGLPDPVTEDLTIDVELERDEAMAWMRAVNDMRLAMGTRLDIPEDYESMLDELGDDDPRAQAIHVYDWLAFVQATLISAVDAG